MAQSGTAYLSLVSNSPNATGQPSGANSLELEPSFDPLPAITDEVRFLSDPYFGPANANPGTGLGNLGPLLDAVSRVLIHDDSAFEPCFAEIEQGMRENPLGVTLEPTPEDWEALKPHTANDLLDMVDHVKAARSDADPIYATSLLDEMSLPGTLADDFDLAAFGGVAQRQGSAATEQELLALTPDAGWNALWPLIKTDLTY